MGFWNIQMSSCGPINLIISDSLALNALALNQKSYEGSRFFEIGRSYVPCGDYCQERQDVIFVDFTCEERKLVEALTLVENAVSLTHSYDVALRPF